MGNPLGDEIKTSFACDVLVIDKRIRLSEPKPLRQLLKQWNSVSYIKAMTSRTESLNLVTNPVARLSSWDLSELARRLCGWLCRCWVTNVQIVLCGAITCCTQLLHLMIMPNGTPRCRPSISGRENGLIAKTGIACLGTVKYFKCHHFGYRCSVR